MSNQQKKDGNGAGGGFLFDAGLLKERAAVAKQLAQSGDAQRLMGLLKESGGVEEAAQAAAAGNTSQLMGMVQKLMSDPEGAKLIDRISRQAQQVEEERRK